jgi:hypothetical protein
LPDTQKVNQQQTGLKIIFIPESTLPDTQK